MTPRFLNVEQVLAIHHDQIERYGGSFELRDRGLLESALAQPRAQFGGAYLHQGVPAMATAYLFHLAKNHAFVDGNKRVAAVAARVFLVGNGWVFNPPEAVYEGFVLRVASGGADKAEATAFFREHAHDG